MTVEEIVNAIMERVRQKNALASYPNPSAKQVALARRVLSSERLTNEQKVHTASEILNLDL